MGTGGTMPVTARFEDVAHHRHELETAKRENEQLKRKVIELEARLRERRSSSAATSP
jgi:cell division septum initiation protein DivIVA